MTTTTTTTTDVRARWLLRLDEVAARLIARWRLQELGAATRPVFGLLWEIDVRTMPTREFDA